MKVYKWAYLLRYLQVSQQYRVLVTPPLQDVGDAGLISGSGRSPGEGNSNPLQFSCLKNPMDRGAWQFTVHWAAKSRTWMSTHTHTQDTKGKCLHCCLSYCVLTGCQEYCKSYIVWSSTANCFCLLSFQMSFETKLLYLTQFCFFWWPVQRVKLLTYLSW